MIWKLPPRIKIFEALGSLADGRIEIEKNEDRKLSLDSARDDKIVVAKVTSADGSKFYTVKYDEASNKITSNDNASKWQGYTGYPIIAVLMKLGKLSYDEQLASGLKGIAWKAINTKHKNDWGKTEDEIFKDLDRSKYEAFARETLSKLDELKMLR